MLLTNAPLLLLALSPIPRHGVLVAPLTDFVPFLLVMAIRRELASVVGYYTGQAYGERAIGFTEQRKPRLGRLVRRVARLFERAQIPVTFFAPYLSAALAGATGMRFPVYLVVSLLGQMWVAALTYYVGDRFKEYILPVVDYVSEHAVAFTLVTVSLVVARQLWRKWKGQGLAPVLPDDRA